MTKTPQTTRCQCGHGLSIHDGGSHHSLCQYSGCACHKFVPAPSAPARAGEPTGKFGKEPGDFDVWRVLADLGLGDRAMEDGVRSALYELKSLRSGNVCAQCTRALAPATAAQEERPLAWGVFARTGELLMTWPDEVDANNSLAEWNSTYPKSAPHKTAPVFLHPAPATAPTMSDPAIYKLVEAAVLKRDDELLEAAKVDLARADDFDAENLALALEMCRKFAPSAFHAALNVAAKRVRAPATAEPTAEMVRQMRVVNARNVPALLHGWRDIDEREYEIRTAQAFKDVELRTLFRGSGPVGQASEAVDSFWNDKHCAKCGSRFRLNESAHYDGSKFAHFPNCPHAPSAVAASAEAKRDAERLDWLEKSLRPLHPPLAEDEVTPQHRHAQDDGWTVVPVHRSQPWGNGTTIRAAIDAAMAAHASPESGV